MKVYLDYNATTPIDNRVAETMRPYLDQYFGNPSSIHSYGIIARKAIDQSRSQVAKLVNASISEIIFTSGGTESNNFALKGIAKAYKSKGKHIITTVIEHPAILEVCKSLESDGFEVSYINVDKNGKVIISELEKAIRPDTILISVMHANNETGVIQPIKEIADMAKKHNCIMHCDAAQSIGKIPVDVKIKCRFIINSST